MFRGIQWHEVKALIGWFVLGALGAYGLLCMLWAVFGWLLPKGGGCAVCCLEVPEELVLRRLRWLRGMGLWDVPILVITEQVRELPGDLETCSREELIARLERERIDGTGNGDHSGRRQRRDLSEL